MKGIYVRSLMYKQSRRWLCLEDSTNPNLHLDILGLTGVQAKACASHVEGIPTENINLIYQGKYVRDDDFVPDGSTLHLVLALPGGKGGFGSMLRAIGAQIEKTTNREACRDLSGRRLRDINEENRLKQWIAKKAERERQASERRRARLERLRSKPKHLFHDPEYERLQSELPDRIDDALTQGLKEVAAEIPESSVKRQSQVKDAPSRKKPCLWFGDENHSSTDSDDPCSGDVDEDSELRESPVQQDGNDEVALLVQEVDKQVGQSQDGSIKDVLLPELLGKEPNRPHPLADQNVQKSDARKTTDLLSLLPPPSPQICQKEPLELPNMPQVLDLMAYESIQELESLGLDPLKGALIALGMKCGGTLQERAQRLWSIRELSPDKIPTSLLAKPSKSKK